MKIGDDENRLIIQRGDEPDPYSGFSISARCGYHDAIFTGSNGEVHFDQAEVAKKSFDEFEALQRNETRIDLTEGCFLALTRQSRGDIQVDFEIHCYRFEAAMRGRVLVAGEDSTGFLQELGRMAYRGEARDDPKPESVIEGYKTRGCGLDGPQERPRTH
jgi:hypothetical protein